MKYNVVGGSFIDFDVFKERKLLVGIPEFKTLRLLDMWQCCSKDGLIYWIIDEYKLASMLHYMHVRHIDQGIYRLTNKPSYCSYFITPQFQNAFVYNNTSLISNILI